MTTRHSIILQGAGWLMLLAPFFFLTYGQVNQFTATRGGIGSVVFSWEQHIPFLPLTIIPYWSLDLLYGISVFICACVGEQRRLVIRLAMASVVACIGFLLFPLKFSFVRPEITGLAGWLFRQLEQFDLPYNQSPSLHIILCWLVWRHLSRHLSGVGLSMLTCWFALIAVSVLTTWQHHFIDIVTGFAAAIVIDWMVPYEGKWRWRQVRGKKRRLALRYLAGAVACIACAYVASPLFWWPATALGVVALAYGRLGVGALQKDGEGQLTFAAWWLLLPWRAGMVLSMRLYTRHLPAVSSLMDGVYLGVYPRAHLLQPAVLDLTSEFPRSRSVQGRAYRCVPMLDLVNPDEVDLRRAVDEVEILRSEHGSVLIHCALGLSRSALVACAWLLQHNPRLSVDAAVGCIRKARQQVVFTSEHLALLKQWKQNLPIS